MSGFKPKGGENPADAAVITIGMPAYNNAATILRAINSVQNQSFHDWHLHISDDQSTDETWELVQKAALSDPRICATRQSTRLNFMNFHTPLAASKTPYFAWLAADDYWAPDFLAETHSALEAAPAAPSAMPLAAFSDGMQVAIPKLGFLKGTASQRINSYLAFPGGTRMYGLMRTELAQACFPARNMNAFDWYLMVCLLAKGPQIEISKTLLFREETMWLRYTEVVDELASSTLFRRFPILEMSLALIRNKKIPLRAMPALIRLNFLKHEEYLAVTRPAQFLRRLPLLKRLGLPISNSPGTMSRIADRLRVTRPELARDVQRLQETARVLGKRRISAPKISTGNAAGPDITAILMCRNAANTLQAALDHLLGLGCRVILIDHGSTDATPRIIKNNRDTIARLIEEPFDGVFDLSRQLKLKDETAGSLNAGWILHADADEFLDPPPGESLHAFLKQAEADEKIAVPVSEHLYLPLLEDEEHDPANFIKTMTLRTQLLERDPKQRLFRHDAPRDLWFRTGGHTISRNPDLLTGPLVLRHYAGLSLDDLRAQYLSRVFAPADLHKVWHGPRMGAAGFDVVEPDHSLFSCTLQGNPEPKQTVKRLPVLRARDPGRKSNLSMAPQTHTDILVLCDETISEDRISAILNLIGPGLRHQRIVATGPFDANWRSLPLLHLLQHPGALHGKGIQRSTERTRAINWTRRLANARQWAVTCRSRYVELRIEDLEQQAELAERRVRALFLSPTSRGTTGYLDAAGEPVGHATYQNPVRTITGALAADLGYV